MLLLPPSSEGSGNEHLVVLGPKARALCMQAKQSTNRAVFLEPKINGLFKICKFFCGTYRIRKLDGDQRQ